MATFSYRSGGQNIQLTPSLVEAALTDPTGGNHHLNHGIHHLGLGDSSKRPGNLEHQATYTITCLSNNNRFIEMVYEQNAHTVEKRRLIFELNVSVGLASGTPYHASQVVRIYFTKNHYGSYYPVIVTPSLAAVIAAIVSPPVAIAASALPPPVAAIAPAAAAVTAAIAAAAAPPSQASSWAGLFKSK